MNNKKAMSEILITVIMIALVLVAIGIVWAVYSNLIEGRTEDIDIGSKCLEIDVKAVSADCTTPTSCSVTLNREAGGDAFDGVKIVFYENATGGDVIDVPGNIEVLATKQVTGKDSGLTTPDKVEVSVYLKDGSGNEQICPGTTSYNF